ncbi:hypothetical protein NW127_00255 [Staphylococcus pettenkoferi]|uniref:hypothetical protein n=1 Tax=Staphylococcus pettenkoferi TaxID=170573 RepID=UPI002275F6F5|nr:hypothetical protein [Staphylococcus pettenkoferi]MCY1575105.1 hypothetical protein [Staphylococcus pettenkoferi]
MNSYTQLRQPVPQILGFFSLLAISFCFVSLEKSGLIFKIPLGLSITTIIEIFFIFSSIIGLLYKPHYKNTAMWRCYLIITVINSYIMLYAVFNMYFLAALYYKIDLQFYWGGGIVGMTSSFILDTIANIILINVTSFKHHMVSLLFRFLGASVYIVYIILYFIVPHNIDNRNDFIHLIFLTLAIHVIVVYLFFMYGDYTYSLEKGEVPE